MITISERLRSIDEAAMYEAPATTNRTAMEAADTIDALVAALEGYNAMARGVTPDANTQTPEEVAATREAIFAAGQAALALARGGV